MRQVAFAASALLAAACAPPAGEAPGAGVQDAPPPPVALDRSILDDPSRPAADREQDGARRALDVYEWFGIRPGMTVGDVFAGAGYNTHLISRIVGAEGRVYAVMEFYDRKDLFEGRIFKTDELRARIADAGLDNVVLLSRVSDLPSGELDAIVIVRNWHDVEWVFPDLARGHVLAELRRALAPGGTVGIVEVATHHEGWHEETHRLNEQVVVDDFTGAGFVLEARSDLLAVPADDHSTSGFEEGRHTMDRYLLRFRKPAAP